MNPKLFLFFMFSLSLIANAQAGHLPSKKNSKTRQNLDACSLLTSAEVEAVQGEGVQETKPGTQPGAGGGLVLSQCVFRTVTPSKSVSIALAVPDSAQSSKTSPRDFWRKQFHPASPEGKEKPGSESERVEEGTKPRNIKGVGEEAFWVSNPVTSILYVLQGNLFMRISIGGIREQSARLEKSKTLARAALKRM